MVIMLMWSMNKQKNLPGVAHLHPSALLLSDVIAVHDVQDLIPDSLGIAAPAHCPQHGPHPFLGLAAGLAVHLPSAPGELAACKCS